MKRNWFLLILLLAIVAFAAKNLLELPESTPVVSVNSTNDHAGTLDALASRGSEIQILDASVTEVIDGDTMVVSTASGTKTVRYLGVDTPERDTPFYNLATRLNGALVHDRTVRLAIDRRQEHDKNGRWLAAVFVESSDGGPTQLVNDELVRAGVAFTYFKGKNVVQDALQDGLVTSQRAALNEQQGLWSKPTNRLGANARNGPVAATRYRFHRPSCGHVENVETTSMRRSEALRSGRSPCRSCEP